MDFSDIKFSDLLKKKNRLLNGLIILLAVIAAYNIHKIQAKNTRALMERKEIELKKNETLEVIARSEQKMGDYKIFLKPKDMSMVINTINELAKNSDVRIISFKPFEGYTYPLYIKSPFEVNLKADSYHSIAKFISKLENHPDIYIIESANLKQDAGALQPAGQEPGDKVAAQLRVSTILFKF